MPSTISQSDGATIQRLATQTVFSELSSWNITMPTTFTDYSRVQAGSEDAWEWPNGTVQTGLAVKIGKNALGGIHFAGLMIPHQALILDARLLVTPGFNRTASVSLKYRIDNVLDASPAFSTANGGLSGIALSSIFVSETPPAYIANQMNASADLSVLLQDTVDRVNWPLRSLQYDTADAEAGALTMLIADSGSSSWTPRHLKSFDNGEELAPMLFVEYTASGSL